MKHKMQVGKLYWMTEDTIGKLVQINMRAYVFKIILEPLPKKNPQWYDKLGIQTLTHIPFERFIVSDETVGFKEY